MDFEAFRMMFPVFGDDKKYPDDFLEMWADASSLHLRKGWSLSGKTYDYALNLMMAHLIYTSGKAAENNGSGMVSSASEGSVSVSFATPTTKNGWEFWLASSPYGLQLWVLLKQLGSGGQVVGGLPERAAVRKVGGVFV